MINVCVRKNCNQYKCSVFIADIGYICNECINEFQNRLGSQNGNIEELRLRKLLENFMNVHKAHVNNVNMTFESFITKNNLL